MTATLQLDNVSYWYKEGNEKTTILDEINVSFEKGKLYTIIGPSGSGKSTLLALASALDAPKEGTLLYNGKDIKKIGYTNYRNKHISLVFQSFNLLPYMNAIQNVISAMEIRKIPGNHKEIAMQYLAKVGLNEKQASQRVMTLSGGQQQRVAVARALACDAEIIFADEPTGNLDRKTAEEVVALFTQLAHDENKCVIIVTHDMNMTKKCDCTFELHDGKLIKK